MLDRAVRHEVLFQQEELLMRRSLKEAFRTLYGPVYLSLAVAFGVMAAGPAPVNAQAVTGTLLGNITDSSGGTVPGAAVTATEVQTNVSRTVVSNESGYYLF